MQTLSKIGIVAGGYIAAFAAASVAVAIHVAATDGPAAQASSGMYAAGDAMLFVAVFGVLALAPTAVALWFLRPHRRFWSAISALGLALAFTSLGAMVLFAVGRNADPASALAAWGALSVLRILVAPLFAAAFLVCTLFSPDRGPRRAFLAAALAEFVVSAYAGCVWFLPLVLGR
jgi:hypothetical protein